MSSQKNLLKIGFSTGALFDTREVEAIYEKEGLRAYLDHLEKMNKNGETFSPGPALGLYMAFKNLQNSIDKDVLDIKFGMVSRNNPNPKFFGVFLRSIRHWILNNENGAHDIDKALDFCCYTNGESIVQAHLAQESDLVFTTSKTSARELYQAGIPAVQIPNESSEKNLELYKKKDGKVVIVADYDGVIGDVNSESVYIAAKNQKGVNAIEAFNRHEIDNKDVPMLLGPLGNVIKKLGRVVEVFENQRFSDESKLNPLKIIVVTARGVSAIERFMNTIGHHDITISQLYMMDGLNKNIPLEQIASRNKGSNILFIDDSEIHFTRSNELVDILSGWVKNDLNIKEIENLERNILKKDLPSEAKKDIIGVIEKVKIDYPNSTGLNIIEREIKSNDIPEKEKNEFDDIIDDIRAKQKDKDELKTLVTNKNQNLKKPSLRNK